MARQQRRKPKPTWADMRREVRAAGGAYVRQGATSHEVWELDGETIVMQSKHKGRKVNGRILKRIRGLIDGT